MESNNNEGHDNITNNALQNEVVLGIAKVLSRWNGLQMAVQYRCGGHYSIQKLHQLAADIFSWFSQSKSTLYMDDVENLLHEIMLLSFNTDIEDGSIEEVAEELMILHEEYVNNESQIIFEVK